jgi:hypothetical protein
MRRFLTNFLARTHKRHLVKIIFCTLSLISSSEIYGCSLERTSIGPLRNDEIILHAKVLGLGFNENLKQDVVRVSVPEPMCAAESIKEIYLAIYILQADCSWREPLYHELSGAFQEGLELDIYGQLKRFENNVIIDIYLPYSGALTRSSLPNSKEQQDSLPDYLDRWSLSDYLDRWSSGFTTKIEIVRMLELVKAESDESARRQLLLELIKKHALALDISSLVKEYVKDKTSQRALKKTWRKRIRNQSR